REERGGDLYEIHAAAGDRGGKAGEVADDAAAERDDEVIAFEFRREKAFHHILQLFPALGAFARGEGDGGEGQAGKFKASHETRQLRLGDFGIGDDTKTAAGE